MYAYGESILAGWGDDNPATDCFIYNGTFYMLGRHALCTGEFNHAILDDSVVHSDGGDLTGCGTAATERVVLSSPAADTAVTSTAKLALGPYPR